MSSLDRFMNQLVSLDVKQLREALDSVGRPPGDPAQSPNAILGSPKALNSIITAARLLADIVEQGEEMDWCSTHDSLMMDERTCQAIALWMGFNADTSFDEPSDFADSPAECEAVPSLRIPSAVLDPAKNEEG